MRRRTYACPTAPARAQAYAHTRAGGGRIPTDLVARDAQLGERAEPCERVGERREAVGRHVQRRELQPHKYSPVLTGTPLQPHKHSPVLTVLTGTHRYSAAAP
jgi:hypothetical protein